MVLGLIKVTAFIILMLLFLGTWAKSLYMYESYKKGETTPIYWLLCTLIFIKLLENLF